jgi:hypothetical protein
MKDRSAFGGVLYDSDAQSMILRNAQALDVGNTGKPVDVDGELLILLTDVAYVQLPG